MNSKQPRVGLLLPQGERCGLCGENIISVFARENEADIGAAFVLFNLEGTTTPVCDACGRNHASVEVAAELEKQRRIISHAITAATR